MKLKTTLKDIQGFSLSVGDLVAYLVEPRKKTIKDVETYRLCRSVIDERLFLLRVHPFIENEREINKYNLERLRKV